MNFYGITMRNDIKRDKKPYFMLEFEIQNKGDERCRVRWSIGSFADSQNQRSKEWSCIEGEHCDLHFFLEIWKVWMILMLSNEILNWSIFSFMWLCKKSFWSHLPHLHMDIPWLLRPKLMFFMICPAQPSWKCRRRRS